MSTSSPVTQSSPAYDDTTTVADLQASCRSAGGHLEQVRRRALRAAPSLYFDEQPVSSDGIKGSIEVSVAASRLAGAIYGE